MNLWKDNDFQVALLSLICRDRNFVKDVGYLLTADDFKPSAKTEDRTIFTVAELAINYWKENRQPIGPVLRFEVLSHAEKLGTADKLVSKQLDLVKEIQSNNHLASAERIAEHVLAYKKSRAMKHAVEKIIGLQEKGELTEDHFFRIASEAVDIIHKGGYTSVDPLGGC
jgi:hypothetical protein